MSRTFPSSTPGNPRGADHPTIKRSCDHEPVTPWEVVGTFVGIPAAVLALIALPIFGPEWWRRRHEDRDDDAGD
jgi:hypothetical protein